MPVSITQGYAHMLRSFKRSAIILQCALFFCVAGCAPTPTIEPVNTTYPKDKVVNRTNIINIPIPVSLGINVAGTGSSSSGSSTESMTYSTGQPILKFDYSETIVGDRAQEEVWIVPRSSREANEDFLLSRIKDVGPKICSDDYRVKHTKFYFGPEATLRFMGIDTPALKVTYRCSVGWNHALGGDGKLVANLADNFSDSRFFDILSFNVEKDMSSIKANLLDAAEARGMVVLERGEEADSFYVLASRPERENERLRPERLVAVVRESGAGTLLTILYMPYEVIRHERGVAAAGTKQPGFFRSPQPIRRDFAYDRTRSFVERLLDQ